MVRLRLVPAAFVATVVLAASAGEADAEDVAAASSAPSNGHVVPPDLDDVEHMCALLTGCPSLPLPTGIVPKDFAGCVRSMMDDLASPGAVGSSLLIRECGLRASSCGALRTCAMRGAKPDVCAGRARGGTLDLCDADGRAITCANERVAMVRDCPRAGEQCVVQNGKASCALGSCEKESAPACSPSGTRVLECKRGKLLSLDCSTFGLRCVSSGDGPQCATSAPTCATGASRCEANDVAVGCWHGHEVRVDCGKAGMTCGASGSTAASSGSVGACIAKPPAEGACDPSSAPRCDGATLKWCAWGKPRSYLCKSVGLSKCVTDDKGSRCDG